MDRTPLHLAVIVGSNREGRFGGTVARWLTDQLGQRTDFSVDVIDLAEVDLPAVLPASTTPNVRAYAERIDAADAFVVVTPEYNHAYPAVLKQAIDIVHAPWQRKPVAFVSYGGLSGGLRAVEQLRLVFAELRATTVRDTVSFHNAWDQFDADGQPRDATGSNIAAKTMLDDLAWWATALRAARATAVGDDPWEE